MKRLTETRDCCAYISGGVSIREANLNILLQQEVVSLIYIGNPQPNNLNFWGLVMFDRS